MALHKSPKISTREWDLISYLAKDLESSKSKWKWNSATCCLIRKFSSGQQVFLRLGDGDEYTVPVIIKVGNYQAPFGGSTSNGYLDTLRRVLLDYNHAEDQRRRDEQASHILGLLEAEEEEEEEQEDRYEER